MEVQSFSEIEAEFLARLSHAVYCSMATVDHKNRPRSRIVHPVWEGSTGWIISWPASHKTRHLQRNPYVSLAYFCHDIYRPVYVDCTVEWVNDRAEQQRVWAYYKTVPPPMGFDPEPHYGTVDHPHFGLLKLTPWRIELFTLGQSEDTGQTEITTRIWRPALTSDFFMKSEV